MSETRKAAGMVVGVVVGMEVVGVVEGVLHAMLGSFKGLDGQPISNNVMWWMV